MARINVLVFPAGEINSIELHDALATCVNINLFGASSKDRHGGYVFENYTSNLPLITDPYFFDQFNEYLTNNSIDVIFPTHDTVALFLVTNAKKIKAKIIAADEKTSLICRDKKLMYESFLNTSFSPRIFSKDLVLKLENLDKNPVFIKPREGQGSVGARLISFLKDFPKNLDEYVVCEYLPGEECTVDCLTDAKGDLKVISPRSRERMLGGICMAGRPLELTKEIQSIAETINKRLSFLGLWFFQLKKDVYGKWKLLEISTRCAGTMCLTRARGYNLPLLSVYVTMGYDVNPILNPYKIIMDRALISRYKIDYKYE